MRVDGLGIAKQAGTAVLLSTVLLSLWPLPADAGQVPTASQSAPAQTGPGSSRPSITVDLAGPGPSGSNAERLQHMREDERRKRLKLDTERLLALTTELKDEVEKTQKDELSLEVVRKAAEIEKLAHDVKERMKS